MTDLTRDCDLLHNRPNHCRTMVYATWKDCWWELQSWRNHQTTCAEGIAPPNHKTRLDRHGLANVFQQIK